MVWLCVKTADDLRSVLRFLMLKLVVFADLMVV
jgi:hypothetical protein